MLLKDDVSDYFYDLLLNGFIEIYTNSVKFFVELDYSKNGLLAFASLSLADLSHLDPQCLCEQTNVKQFYMAIDKKNKELFIGCKKQFEDLNLAIFESFILFFIGYVMKLFHVEQFHSNCSISRTENDTLS